MDITSVFLFFLCIITAVSQLYFFSFQGSKEGKDERGTMIRNIVGNRMYLLLNNGIIILLVLELTEVFTSEQFVNILLYYILVVSLFGGVTSFLKRKEL
ncbi:hypothetical protein D3C87_1576510 [compost metagenome]